MHNELIDALRCGTLKENQDKRCNECEYYSCGNCGFTIIMADAADAIERLVAEVDRKDKALQAWVKTWEQTKGKLIDRICENCETPPEARLRLCEDCPIIQPIREVFDDGDN